MANTSTHSGMRRKKLRQTPQYGPALIEHVRVRAYELYESRGKQDGHDLDDWLLAEKQVIHTTPKKKGHY